MKTTLARFEIEFLFSRTANSSCVQNVQRKNWTAAKPCGIASIVDRWLIYENVHISSFLEFELKIPNVYLLEWRENNVITLQQLNKEPSNGSNGNKTLMESLQHVCQRILLKIFISDGNQYYKVIFTI